MEAGTSHKQIRLGGKLRWYTEHLWLGLHYNTLFMEVWHCLKRAGHTSTSLVIFQVRWFLKRLPHYYRIANPEMTELHAKCLHIPGRFLEMWAFSQYFLSNSVAKHAACCKGGITAAVGMFSENVPRPPSARPVIVFILSLVVKLDLGHMALRLTRKGGGGGSREDKDITCLDSRTESKYGHRKAYCVVHNKHEISKCMKGG